MYTARNFKTKKELKTALSEGPVELMIYGPFDKIPESGTVYLEGPHYPEPHKWYAQGTVENGKLVKIK